MDKKKIKKINIILRYIIISLTTFLIIRYSTQYKINYNDSICMVSLITLIVLLLDMFLPIIE